MSLSGPKVLEALEEALRDLRHEEDDILRKLVRSAERMAKIEETEAELLSAFARVRLPPEQADRLLAPVEAAAAATRNVLTGRARDVAAGVERLAGLDRELATLSAQRTSALTAIDHQQTALRGLSARIGAAMERDPAYSRQQQAATRLRAVAAAARAKARQTESEREQKARAFRADPLFSYLLARRFSTAEYRGSGLVAGLDAWVARLIGFSDAQRQFALLSEWPARLQAHAAQQAARAAAADEAIEEIERRAIDAAGGATVRTALAEAQGRIAEIDSRIAVLAQELDATLIAQARLAAMDDAAFDRAAAGLAAALGSPDLPALILAARAAAPNPDDAVIAQLDDARLRLDEERIDAREQRLRLTTLAARRGELGTVIDSLKAQRFDDPRSVFRDDNLIGGELDSFLTGALSAEGYAHAFARSHGWTVGTSEWGGGIGLPRHGRSGSPHASAHDEAVPDRQPTAGAA